MLNRLKKIIFDRSVIRFCIVGCCCTLIDFVIYMFTMEYIGVIFGKSISMGCSMVINYCLNKFWSFSAKDRNDKAELVRYIFSQIINICTNVSINFIVLYISHIKILAFVCATGVAMIVNYLLQKFWVFKSNNK